MVGNCGKQNSSKNKGFSCYKYPTFTIKIGHTY